METQETESLHKPFLESKKIAKELFFTPKISLRHTLISSSIMIGIAISYYVVQIANLTGIEKNLLFWTLVSVFIMWFSFETYLFIKARKHTFKAKILRSEKGADFEAIFQKTTRFRYEVTRKNGLVYTGAVTNNNLDCSKLLYVTANNDPHSWIFVECKKPRKGEFYIQIIPYLLFSEKNKYALKDGSLTMEGMRGNYSPNQRLGDIPYQFKLNLPMQEFYHSEPALFVLGISLFNHWIVPSKKVGVEGEKEVQTEVSVD